MKLGDVLGQRRAISVLVRSLENGRPAHAYLLHGPESVGKELTARAFAASSLCAARSGPDACGRCPSCERLARGVHADLSVVLPEDQAISRGLATKGDFDGKASSTIRVATIRELNGWLASRPVEGATRIALVLDAHRMGPEAQNALLKTLEEPRAGRSLVLVTSAPSALLATVRSRCQKLRFGTVDPSAMTAILERELGVDLVPSQIAAVVARAGGSVGSALALARSGALEPSPFEASLSRLRPDSIAEVLDLAESLGGERATAAELLDALTALLAKRARGELELPAGGVLASLSRRRVTDLIDQVARLRATVVTSANVTLAIEDLLLGLCASAAASLRTSARSAGT